MLFISFLLTVKVEGPENVDLRRAHHGWGRRENEKMFQNLV